MKLKFLALALGCMAIAADVTAQNNGKSGNDPVACEKYQSKYQSLYQQGDFRAAMPWWNLALQTCPRYSKNLYKQGVKMFENEINSEPDARRKDILIDSLLWVYDQRINYFGDDTRAPKGYILGLKGVAIQKYRRTNYPKSYSVLGESISLMGMQSSAAVVLTYMQASQQLFRDGIINAAKALSDYETTMEIIDANLQKNPDDKGFRLTRNQVELYYANSGAASCEALTALYASRFESHREDAPWLRKSIRQLKKNGCTSAPVYTDVAEALLKLEPLAEDARDIGLAFARRNEPGKAADYLQKAISIGQRSDELPDMYYELASLYFNQMKDYRKARAMAMKALEARPNWGMPYLLIGQIYIAARQELFKDQWNQSTVYWVAADLFIKSKSVDPEVADVANNLINSCIENFPNPDMLASRTLRDGDTYTVGGWINETTRVRSRKT